MNLISCQECGVVLDKDILPFASDIFGEDGEVDDKKGVYHPARRAYVAYVHCPVCKSQITE